MGFGEFGFGNGSGGGGGGGDTPLIPSTNVAETFALLPDPVVNDGKWYEVRTTTTTGLFWFSKTTKSSGLYEATGGDWEYRGADVPEYLEDDNFAITDEVTGFKIGFNADSITDNRRLSPQDKSYVIADHADLQSHISNALIHQPSIQYVEGGRNNANATNLYLRSTDRMPMNLNGTRLFYNCTLVGLLVSTSGVESWTAEVRKNNVLTPVYSEVVVSSDFVSSTPDIEFDVGDEVQFYCNGSTINRPKIIGVFQRR